MRYVLLACTSDDVPQPYSGIFDLDKSYPAEHVQLATEIRKVLISHSPAYVNDYADILGNDHGVDCIEEIAPMCEPIPYIGKVDSYIEVYFE